MNGGTISQKLDEQLVFNKLSTSQNAIWSLLVMSGYLKSNLIRENLYEIQIVNHETMLLLRSLIEEWFDEDDSYNDFLSAFLKGDLKTMNKTINELTVSMMSTFDSGTKPSSRTPERFYHGFVLGLLVELRDTYTVTSNRESGYGRYDILLEPKNKQNDAIILEFKVLDEDDGEKELSDSVKNALEHIEKMKYEQTLTDKGVPSERIRKYGFAFEGKKVLIGQG
jgi:hypothetical protein